MMTTFPIHIIFSPAPFSPVPLSRSAEHPEDAREGRERKEAENGRDGKERPKPMSRMEVLPEICRQWNLAEKEERPPQIRYGYVKREESSELFIYGRGLDALDKVEYHVSVCAVNFNFVLVKSILAKINSL